MKYLVIPLAVLLAGCQTVVPVTAKFPDPVSEDVMKSCPDLQLVKVDTEKLTDLIEIVADNYKEYHACRDKVNDWIKWYKKQKENYEKVGK